MPVQFDPASRTASTQAPIEVRSSAPLGRGDGTTTLHSMAPVEDSGCCVWNMLSSLWNWLKRLCFSSSKAEPTAEIGQNTQELLPQDIEQKIKKTLKAHFSARFLDRMDIPEWKVGVIIKLDGQFFIRSRQLNREDAIPFRNEITRQIEENEWVKNKIKTLAPDSKLEIDTYFMHSVDGKNRFFSQWTIVSSSSGTVYKAGSGDTSPLTIDETRKYLECRQYPAEFTQFFLNP